MATNKWDELLNADLDEDLDFNELLDARPSGDLIRDPDDADDWQITKGLKQGWEQLEGIGGGAKGLLGEIIGNDQMRDQGYADYLRNMAEASEYKGNVTTYKDVKDLNSAIDYALHGIGTTLPMFLPSLFTGGAGAQIGKQIVGQAIKRRATTLLGEGVAKSTAFRKAAEEVSKQMVGKSGTIGANVGGATGSIGMQSGMIYGDVREQTGESRADVALSFGAITGMLDAIPVVNVLNRFGVGKTVRDGIAKELTESGKSFLFKQMISEGGTEMLQTIGEQAAVAWVDENREMFTPEQWEEIVNAGLLGMLGGGALSAPAAMVKGVQGQPQEDETISPDDPDIGGAPPAPVPPAPDPVNPVNEDGTLNVAPEELQQGDALQGELDLGAPGGPVDALDAELDTQEQPDMLDALIEEDAPQQTDFNELLDAPVEDTTVVEEEATTETPVVEETTDAQEQTDTTEATETEATTTEETTQTGIDVLEEPPEWVAPENESPDAPGMFENNDDSDTIATDATGRLEVVLEAIDEEGNAQYAIYQDGVSETPVFSDPDAAIAEASAMAQERNLRPPTTTTDATADATTVDEPETATRTETELLFDGPTPIFTTPDLADDAVGVDSTGRIEMVILRETPEGNMIYGVRVDGVIDNNTKGKPREYKTTKGAQNRVNWHRNQGLPTQETADTAEVEAQDTEAVDTKPKTLDEVMITQKGMKPMSAAKLLEKFQRKSQALEKLVECVNG